MFDLFSICMPGDWGIQKKEEIRSSGTGTIDGCELPRKYWELNPGPQEEKPVLFPMEQSLWTHLIFIYLGITCHTLSISRYLCLLIITMKCVRLSTPYSPNYAESPHASIWAKLTPFYIMYFQKVIALQTHPKMQC